MATGTVKWFDNGKGYGFIQPDEGGRDVFVHVRQVEKARLQGRVQEGTTLVYDVGKDRDGRPCAENLELT